MNRFKQVDILRAIAVFLVLGRHMKPCPPDGNAWCYQTSRIWAQGGWVGVDLFFVLSGFLVSGLLFREYEKYHELRVGCFLIRRGFKIYPPFWLLIGVTVALLALHHVKLFWPAIASELLFVQNYGPNLWNHTWSLAVEEHFYLLLAGGLFILARRRSPDPFAMIPAAFVAVAVICLLLRVVDSPHPPFDFKAHIFRTHLRLDGLFFGVFLSYVFHRHPIWFFSVARRFRYALGGMGALMLLPAFCFPLEETPSLTTYGLTLFYLGSGCLLCAALGFSATGNRCVRAVAYMGSHSYSIYLWHMQVSIWVTALVTRHLSQPDNWLLYAAIYLIGSIVFGIGMAILIENPVLRLRNRYFPSRGEPLSFDAKEAKPKVLIMTHTGESGAEPILNDV